MFIKYFSWFEINLIFTIEASTKFRMSRMSTKCSQLENPHNVPALLQCVARNGPQNSKLHDGSIRVQIQSWPEATLSSQAKPTEPSREPVDQCQCVFSPKPEPVPVLNTSSSSSASPKGKLRQDVILSASKTLVPYWSERGFMAV